MTSDHSEAGQSHPHPAAASSEQLAAECDFQATRRSGPGGQNRNKVETAVILSHRPTGIRAEASERRTQGENRRQALFRLRLTLAIDVRRELTRLVAGSYRPSPLWQSRCRGGRLSVNTEHDDFPALLAEALDVLAACSFEPREAAEALGCSSTQLVKLLKRSPRSLMVVNQARRERGRHDLV